MAKSRKTRSRAVAHARPRKSNSRRRTRISRRRNPGTRIMVMKPRHRRSRGTARNPQFFGRSMKVGEVAKVVAGGLVGVGVTKMVVPMLPSTLTGNNLAKFASAVAIALAAGFLANKVSNDFGSAVTFGALMEAASIGLNPYIPLSQYTGLSGVRRGVGAYVPAQFNEPQNPFPQGLLPAGGGMATRGVYGSPYARRAAA